jgi:hypothetical protein
VKRALEHNIADMDALHGVALGQNIRCCVCHRYIGQHSDMEVRKCLRRKGDGDVE